MQNAEGLRRALINRHAAFEEVSPNFGKLKPHMRTHIRTAKFLQHL